jgi:hypothetical protein
MNASGSVRTFQLMRIPFAVVAMLFILVHRTEAAQHWPYNVSAIIYGIILYAVTVIPIRGSTDWFTLLLFGEILVEMACRDLLIESGVRLNYPTNMIHYVYSLGSAALLSFLLCRCGKRRKLSSE